MKTLLALVVATATLVLPGCQSARPDTAPPAVTARGTLLLIGGGLDDDNRAVYERFLALASASGPAHVVIATAASLEQDEAATDKTEALRTWAPGIGIDVIQRETPAAETVAAIDRASAMFFTGGDQQRITNRYRPGNQDTPEWLAMRRLLARGGVIAGTSAGDAMMGEIMFLSGGSATALGIVPPRSKSNPDEDDDDEDPARLGPRLGPGMHLLPDAISDSHFFERDRIGRLVAALELTGVPLGIGVGEDACVEVDLASGDLRGVSASESLLIDTEHLRRDGLSRTGLVARVIRQGDRLNPAEWLAHAVPVAPPSGPVRELPMAGPGQNRELAAWRLFREASEPNSPAVRQTLAAYTITAYPAASGNVAFEIHAVH